MKKRYSIAEARNVLGSVVHEAEARGVVELTRRGETVAVVLSLRAYGELCGERRSFWHDVEALRSSGVPSPNEDEFDDTRDRSAGRPVDL